MGMMTPSADLATFSFDGHPVRIVPIGTDHGFLALDVCAALQLSNPSVALAKFDADEVTKFNLGGRVGEVLVLTEAGLSTIIMRSKKAMTPGSRAYRFRKWVTGEVLPQIRRTGSYGAPAAVDPRQFLADPRNLLALLGDYARALDEERDAHCLTQEHLGQTSKALTIQTLRNADLAQDLGAARGRIEAIQPRALAFERLAGTNGSNLISDVAKDVGMPPGKLFDFLDTQSSNPNSPGWIYRRKPGGDWICAQRALDIGLVEQVIEQVELPDGRTVTRRQARITDKGRARLAEILSLGKIQPRLAL
jgi:prophage antirepressor-like protein